MGCVRPGLGGLHELDVFALRLCDGRLPEHLLLVDLVHGFGDFPIRNDVSDEHACDVEAELSHLRAEGLLHVSGEPVLVLEQLVQGPLWHLCPDHVGNHGVHLRIDICQLVYCNVQVLWVWSLLHCELDRDEDMVLRGCCHRALILHDASAYGTQPDADTADVQARKVQTWPQQGLETPKPLHSKPRILGNSDNAVRAWNNSACQCHWVAALRYPGTAGRHW
mmetsp:Transcript_138667/g.386712  ORF Transcript_138667/g.386712 Transcript_138667/m.386712 type:complete len:222 (-) Transcript_138667:154-819(-)